VKATAWGGKAKGSPRGLPRHPERGAPFTAQLRGKIKIKQSIVHIMSFHEIRTML
jgi:hypothetical protein